MSDKTIKVSIAVDENSARKAKALVDDLTRSVERLVAASSKIGGSTLGGQVAGGASVTMRSPQPGGIRHMAAAAQQGRGGVFANILGGDQQTLRGLVSGAQQAFQSVSSSIKTFTDRAESDLRRLQRAVAGVNASMGGMAASVGGGRGGPYVYAPGGGGGGRTLPGIAPGFIVPGTQVPGVQATPASPGGRGGGGARPPAAAGGMAGGVAGGAGGALANAMGLGFLGRLGGPAAIGAAGVAAYQFGVSAMEDERLAKLQYRVSEPIDRLSRRAAVAAPFQHQFSAVMGGQVSSTVAFRQALQDPEVKRTLMGSNVDRAALAKLTVGTSSYKLGNLGKQLKGYAGRTLEDFTSWLQGQQGLTADERRNSMQLAEDVALRNIGPEQAQQLQAAAAAKLGVMNPWERDVRDTIYQGAHSRVAALRATGRAAGVITLRDGTKTSAYEYHQARLHEKGWTLGDEAAGRNTMLGVGAGYMKALGPLGVVSAGIGGLHNAAQLTRMGGILGGSVGAAGKFYRGTVQGGIGRGGLDVAAGSQLFDMLGQHAMQTGQFGAGNAFSTYAGAAAGLVGGGMGAPLDVAEQQRRIMMLQSGGQNFASFTQGTKAPLYEALSLYGAMGATGGYSLATEGLRKMDPGLLQAIARGGDVPEWARAQGIDANAARSFLGHQAKAPLAEVVDRLAVGDSAGLLKDVRAAEAGGGTFKDVFRARTSGLKGGAAAREITKLSEQLGGVLASSGLAQNAEAGAGTFLAQLLQDPEFAPMLKGKGVGAAGPKGPEALALKAQADIYRKQGLTGAALEARLKEEFPDMPKHAIASAAAVSAAAGGQGDSVDTAVHDLVGALQRFASSLKAQQTGGGSVMKAR